MESGQQDPASARLSAIVDRFPGKRFVVIDGGHFPDLPAKIKNRHLFARSLFLDTADPAIQAAGPWLVGLDQAPDVLDSVTRMVGDLPAAVFWSCGSGEAVLHRHLRSLNMAQIPAWAARGDAPPTPGAGPSSSEAVFFRHYDPSVLGALMPVLGAAQFARILGPAEEVAFHAAD